jgi:copper chaperone CopZ
MPAWLLHHAHMPNWLLLHLPPTARTTNPQVVAAYQARGFQIQSINTNHGFLKVSHPTALPAAAVASVSPPAAAGGRAAPAWLPPHAWSQARALSPGDGPEGPIYPRGAEAAARAAAALSPAGEPEAVAATWGGAPTTMQVSTMAASPTIAAAIAALSEVPGVDTVEVNVQAHLMRSKHYARTLQQAMAAAGGSGVCAGAKPKNGPDTDTGKFGEAAPYGVTMVQADAPEMVEVSKAHAGKVIFCVLDTGLDRSNVEFEHGCEWPRRRAGCAAACVAREGRRAARVCALLVVPGTPAAAAAAAVAARQY